MKRLFFFPVWKVEKIEQEFSRLEQEGWRLTKCATPFLFCFTLSNQKKTQYFFTYSEVKGRKMQEIEHFLKSKLNADEINNSSLGFFSITNVYRMTQPADLEKLRFYRNVYLQHFVSVRIMASLGLPVITVACGILQQIQGGFSAQQLTEWTFLLILSSLSLLLCGWYIYGLCQLKRQYKQIRKHISISYEDLQC